MKCLVLSCLLSLLFPPFSSAARGDDDPFHHLEPYAPLKPDPATSREVILSGGGAAHFACESADHNLRAYHGLYAGMHEFLDGWQWLVGRRDYTPRDAREIEVWPFALRRHHDDGTVEEVFLPRARDALLLTLSPGSPGTALFRPWVDMRHIWRPGRHEYRAEWNERLGALFISRGGFEPPAGVPRVMALIPDGGAEWLDEPRDETRAYPRDAARRAMASATPHSPGRFAFEAAAGQPIRMAVGLGVEQRAAFAAARELIDSEAELRGESLMRCSLRMTDGSGLGFPAHGTRRPTGLPETDRALVWARWSLANLTMNARGPGIYAGYHWFTNYWGRDSFISLPGACLVNRNFGLARDILGSFAEHQLREADSQRLGRLPNIVNPDALQYAGVDGTWWWVRAVRLYLDYSGDRDFIATARPVVERAVAGALAKAVDEQGLLTHGDGETWMDAGGEANPFSPRGDRAVEVQVLWWDGLRTAALLAEWDGDEAAAARYGALAARAHAAIRQLFRREDGSGLADHLNPDGSQDTQLRPNQIFALTLPRREGAEDGPHNWWGEALSREILDTVVEYCVLPHGVTSLAPQDPAWLGRHLDLDHHYYDAAYHNGDVWLWLSGPVIQALCEAGRQDEAWSLLDPLTRDLLERGAVGSMREIRDGEARDLEDFGGATSQAWSLAEYLRVYHEAFLGWTPRAMERSVIWRPRPPAALPQLAALVGLDDAGSGSRFSYAARILGEKLRFEQEPVRGGARPPKEPWTLQLVDRKGGTRILAVSPDWPQLPGDLEW